MKYRSPSPDASLPTPPQSPTSYEANDSAVTLLDSLTAFYQQERYWVHHTRASLELALSKGIDAPPMMLINSPSPSSVSSPESTSSISSSVSASAVKVEPTTPPPMDRPTRKSLWMRRKAGMKLKLENLASQHRRKRPLRAPPTEPSTRLLEMFSELLDARMESCQRISRLVRDSNSRPSYCEC